MKRWAQQHRTLIRQTAMGLLVSRVCSDGLAAVGVLPITSRDHLTNPTLVLVLGLALSNPDELAAPGNWVARHRGWATLIGVAVLVGMIWAGDALSALLGTPLASRIPPDALIMLGFGYWTSMWLRGRGPVSPA